MQTQKFGSDTGFSDAAGAETNVRIDQAAAKVHETVDRVHRKASEVTDRVATDGERMYDQACDWVSDHPLQAVAGALLAGYLFARIRN